MAKCPRCKKNVLDKIRAMNALSRRDNKTHICSECGTKEALFDFHIQMLHEQEVRWLKGGKDD